MQWLWGIIELAKSIFGLLGQRNRQTEEEALRRNAGTAALDKQNAEQAQATNTQIARSKDVEKQARAEAEDDFDAWLAGDDGMHDDPDEGADASGNDRT